MPAPWLELINREGLNAAQPPFEHFDETHLWRFSYLYLGRERGPLAGLQVLHQHPDGSFCGGDLAFEHQAPTKETLVWTPLQMQPIWLKERVTFPCGDTGRIVNGSWVSEVPNTLDDNGLTANDYADAGS